MELAEAGTRVGFLLVRLALELGVLALVVFGLYFLMTLPWRRRERAAVLLDLLELGRRDGRSSTEIIASLGTVPDRHLPVRLHLLSARLESGIGVDAALDCVPQLLPPPIDAMLRTGFRHGRPDQVLSVCRAALRSPLHRDQSVLIYLLLLCSFFGIISFVMIGMLRVVVLPKFSQIMVDMVGPDIDDLWQVQALELAGWVFVVGIAVMVAVNLALFSHVGGPRLWGYLGGLDRLALWIPWRRDRIHRDFAGMLGLLLDGGVPESMAVSEAARATGNRVVERRAAEVTRRLQAGEPLPQAIRSLDTNGEFLWRLANARHGSLSTSGAHFTNTLRVWLEALEARAAQRESNAAQAMAAAMILIFGAAVALECIGVFGLLVYLVEGIS